MAGTQLTIPISCLEHQRLEYQRISLTHFDDGLEPQICAGSVVEIAGALFLFSTLESITGWGSIGNGNDVYIKLVVSDIAVTAEFTTTAPTRSTSKQGWYVGLDRYIGGLYKDGSGNYTAKWLHVSQRVKDKVTTGGLQDGAATIVKITKAFTENTQVISADDTWVIPEGLVQIVNITDGAGFIRLELYISGAWREERSAQASSWLVRSDGTNMRLKNAHMTESATIYWQVF